MSGTDFADSRTRQVPQCPKRQPEPDPMVQESIEESVDGHGDFWMTAHSFGVLKHLKKGVLVFSAPYL